MEIVIKEIKFISNVGYQIFERPLDTYVTSKGEIKKTGGDSERRAYEKWGDEFCLIEETKKLDNYKGLLNSYKQDLKIVRITGHHTMTISEYEAMKYVIENKTKDWSQSPYSASFYSSKQIDWGYKPEGSLRVSDHWNFGEYGQHCPTTDSQFTQGWAVGKFVNGKYEIIKKF